MAKYKSIDLFAGIGGIRLGFDYAFENEIETVFVSEWDEYAQKTYRANFDDPFEIAGDITKINEKDIPDFDICLAGFPCQAFSLAGKRLGFNDDYKGLCRGTLFMDVARICEYHKPKVIFCENVKGLTIHDHGKTFKVITQTFESLGYKVFYKILNSKNFGVPQNRERIYIVCFRNDVAPVDFEFPEAQEKKVCLRDVLDEAPVPSKYYLSDTYVETLKRHKARHQALGHGFGYEIRDLNGIAGTIVCGGTSDIVMEVMDYRSGSNCTLGFSCKSNLTAQATLFNASKNNTNFIYEVTGPMTDEIMNEFNSLVDDKGHVPISARIQYLKKKNMNVLFVSPAVESAKRNLILSGGKEMPLIVGGLLKYYYWENEAKSIHSSLLDGLTYVTENDIADYQLEDLRSVYERKISTLLYDMFTGMRLASNWDGHSSVNGGYIVLKPDGSVVAYHSIIADQFKEYLIDSLAFDTPSVNRHDYMKIYKKEGKYYLKFNMQIRFRKKNDN